MPQSREDRLAYNRRWYQEHREEQRTKMRIWYLNNADYWKAYNRNRPPGDPVQLAWSRVTCQDRKDGRPEAEYPTRPIPSVCEECGKVNKSGRRLHLDHDHVTGRFRGWLCSNCNTSIGHAFDDPALLRKLADYVERNQC